MREKADKIIIEGEIKVKDILRARGLKMYQLAELMGITPESLTRALQRNPQYSTLKSIADALGVSVRDLFVEGGEPIKSIVRGTVEVQGKVRHIDNLEDIYRLTAEVEKAYEEARIPLPTRR